VAFEDDLVLGDPPKAAVQAVGIAFLKKLLTTPAVHSGLGDAELVGDLAGREQTAATQPLVAARQSIGAANESDLLEIEGLSFPGPAAFAIEDLGDLAIAVIVEKAIDLRHQVQLELADLGDRQGTIQLEELPPAMMEIRALRSS
jgi:hypothetical protein